MKALIIIWGLVGILYIIELFLNSITLGGYRFMYGVIYITLMANLFQVHNLQKRLRTRRE